VSVGYAGSRLIMGDQTIVVGNYKTSSANLTTFGTQNVVAGNLNFFNSTSPTVGNQNIIVGNSIGTGTTAGLGGLNIFIGNSVATATVATTTASVIAIGNDAATNLRAATTNSVFIGNRAGDDSAAALQENENILVNASAGYISATGADNLMMNASATNLISAARTNNIFLKTNATAQASVGGSGCVVLNAGTVGKAITVGQDNSFYVNPIRSLTGDGVTAIPNFGAANTYPDASGNWGRLIYNFSTAEVVCLTV
ncbi:MAG: hypothetical protein KDD60_12895, partial [Bdellovibrionales bacterium]|nr:hypothetical protein [Bdellovibrionales bacterium]